MGAPGYAYTLALLGNFLRTPLNATEQFQEKVVSCLKDYSLNYLRIETILLAEIAVVQCMIFLSLNFANLKLSKFVSTYLANIITKTN